MSTQYKNPGRRYTNHHGRAQIKNDSPERRARSLAAKLGVPYGKTKP